MPAIIKKGRAKAVPKSLNTNPNTPNSILKTSENTKAPTINVIKVVNISFPF